MSDSPNLIPPERRCQGCDGMCQTGPYEMLRYDPRTSKWKCGACINVTQRTPQAN